MQFTIARDDITGITADCYAVCVTAPPKGTKASHGALGRADGGQALDQVLDGLLSTVIRQEEFRGELGAYRLVPTAGRLPAHTVALIGAGPAKAATLETARRLGATLAKAAEQCKARRVAGVLQAEAIGGAKPAERAKALLEGVLLGGYRFDHYKAKEDRKPPPLAEIILVATKERAAIEAAMAEGRLIGEAVNFARDLANQPSNVCTPHYLAEQARAIARQGKLACTVFDAKEISAHRMHLLTAVAQGAPNPPVFIHLRYTPPKKAKAHIALVGKGVTFDTGGVDLKTSKHMEHMKNDMAGAASVLATMKVVSALRPDLLIDAFVPCTENVIDGKSHRPGDIVAARSGKTVELVNLDAEGRL
ncbi:MAG: hypothetical protein HY543_00975, partial [Deltaproteobacteria bacterium]|nr:hypothetical protein [Deltaproteobacteria bacterium]